MFKNAMASLTLVLTLLFLVGSPHACIASMNSHTAVGKPATKAIADSEPCKQSTRSEQTPLLDNGDTGIGILEYSPPPKISICFCGSFYLRGESGFKNYYLVSDSFDLFEYIGKKIVVHGKAFSGYCAGTLAIRCNYLDVQKITTISIAGTETINWGNLKTIYR